MKKKNLILLAFILCILINISKVDACTWPQNFNDLTQIKIIDIGQSTAKTSHKIGDKIRIRFYSYSNFDSNVKMNMLFKSINSDKIVSVQLKDIALANEDNNIEYNANFIVTEEFGDDEYEYYGLDIIVNDKKSSDEICKKYIFDSKYLEENKDYNPSSLSYVSGYKTLKVVSSDERKDILKGFSLFTYTSNYYIGDKLTFNVTTTEEISSMSINFYNKTSLGNHNAMFTVDLKQECLNGNCRYIGYIPKTLAGYYATVDGGRTETTIYEGTYEVNSVFIYDKNGNLIRYTTDKDYANDSDYLYYPYKISINLKEPTADELNDTNFILKKFKLNAINSSIGSEVGLDLDYSYDNSKKKLKSVYLIFRDSSKKRTFTSYLKSLSGNPYFIIASSADIGTYKLDSIGVTFEANDGTNNTIIINDKTDNGRYNEIFNQNITVDNSSSNNSNNNINNNVMYFSAEELNDEVYQRIRDKKDDSPIIVDADNHSIIPAELFELIKENAKQLIVKNNNNEWVFNGENIDKIKNIDVSMKYYDVGSSTMLSSLKELVDNESLIFEFPNNGELPENVLIRVKNTDIINKLNDDKYYIYYVDSSTNKLSRVALGVEKTSEGSFEFYINHNSKYLISSTELNDEAVLGSDDASLEKNNELIKEKNVDDVEKDSSNKTTNNIFMYCIIIGGIIAAIVIALVVLKKKNKLSNSNNEKTIE